MIDEGYLDLVRSRPCCICGKQAPSDPHHLQHRQWREANRDDATAIPVCRRCHNLFHSIGIARTLLRSNLTAADLIAEVARNLVKFFLSPGTGNAPF